MRPNRAGAGGTVRAVTATAMALVLSAVSPLSVALLESGRAWAGSDQLDRALPDGAPAADVDAVFRVTGVEVLAERDAPEICIHFNRALDPDQIPGALVTLTEGDGARPAIRSVPQAKGICLLGVRHGGRYRLGISGSLRAVDGTTLAADSEQAVVVPDRGASLVFGDAGFLRTHQTEALTLRSINVAAARIRLFRVSAAEGLSERALADAYFDAGAAGRLERIGKDAREVWSGVIALDDRRNQPTTTQVPLAAVAGRLEPGVYVASARPEAGPQEVASAQWFLVSDLGINTVMGDDGLLIFARSLSTAKPAAGVTVAVIGRDRGELAHAVTDGNGLARIDAGALTTTVDKAPQVLLARSGDDVAVVELRGPRDTAEVGDEDGETAPFSRPRLDGLIATDRRVYAPGSRIVGFVALRDVDGREVTGEKVRLELARPDGGVIGRAELDDAGGGGATFDLRLPGTAPVGDWTLKVFDPTGEAVIGQATIRVDDGPRLGLTLGMAAEMAAMPSPIEGEKDGIRVRLDLSALTAARTPASKMNGRAFLTVAPARDAFSAYPDYRFADSSPDADPGARKRYPLGDFEVGTDGKARLDLPLPDGIPVDRAFDAVIEAELTVAGTPVATAHRRLPHRPSPISVGLHPRFDGVNVPDGATVAFDVIAVDRRDGARVARSGVAYELIAEDSEFEWYESQGHWDYRRVLRDRRVAGGTLDLSATEPARLAEPVAAGRYRLEVRDPGGAVAVTRFSAGWWMSPRPGPDPGRVDVVAMRPAVPAEARSGGDATTGGDEAWVFVRPPHPSQVLLMVADRRVRWADVRTVGAEGALIKVPLDGVSSHGAHVVATAFALPNADYHGPPRRALGTAWLPGGVSSNAPGPVIEAPTSTTAGGDVAVRLGASGVDEPTFGLVALVPAAIAADAFAEVVASGADEPKPAVGLRDVHGGLIPTWDRPSPVPPRKIQPSTANADGVVGMSPVTALADVGDGKAAATLSVRVPPNAAPGAYRLIALTWNGNGVARTTAPLTVGEPDPSVRAEPPSPSRALTDPVVTWRGELATGERVALAELFQAGDRLLLSSDAIVGVDLAESAARMTRPGPALGTEAAASRLLAALALGYDATGPHVTGALDELIAMWRPDGAFAAWGADGAPDPWLTAHALDVMRRAAEAGAPVSPAVTERTAAWLANWWDGCWSDPADLPACTYAAAVLTVTGRPGEAALDKAALDKAALDKAALDKADVLFLDETFGPHLPTTLSRAHLAVALAAVGERDRATRALARLPGTRREENAGRDHGSVTRDAAAVVAVLARSRVADLAAGASQSVTAEVLNAAVERLNARRVDAVTPSDRAVAEGEAAWSLSAARVLSDPRLGGAPLAVTLRRAGTDEGSASADPGLTPLTLIPLTDEGAPSAINIGSRAARLAVIGDAPTTVNDGEASSWTWTRPTGAPLGPGESEVGDALTAAIDLRLTPADRSRRVRLSVSLPPWMEPLTAPAAPGTVRARKTTHGVGVVFAVPAGSDQVRVSFAVRVRGRPETIDSRAVASLESLERSEASITRVVIHAPPTFPDRDR